MSSSSSCATSSDMVNQAEIVFVRLTVPFILGILCFSQGQGTVWLYVLLGLGATIILLLGILNLRFSSGHLHKRVVYVAFYIFPFLLAGSLTILNDQLAYTNHFSKFESDYLKIQIIEEPKEQANSISIRAKVLEVFRSGKSICVSGQLLISIQKELDSGGKIIYKRESRTQKASVKQIKSSDPIFDYGDQLFVPGNFKMIAEPRNPYEFDLRTWYKHQNFHHQLFVHTQQVLKYKSGQGDRITHTALRLRRKQVQYFRKLLHNDEANAVAATLILGYRADLSEETLSAYSKTGTIHALSVSGMHVGLVYLIINFLFGFLNRWHHGRIIKFIVAIGLVWFYAIIAGLAPSVLRSAIMLSIYITGTTFKKYQNSYNLLCCAAFMMLLYNPLLIYDVGFQLSYLSVFGLIFLQPLIYKWFDFQNIAADKLWNFFALSLAAQLATFPLAIYYFHQFPLYFLISNLFILLPVSLIMYLGIAILLFRLDFLGPLFEYLINFNNLGLRWISELPFASISGIWISQTELLLLSFALSTSYLAFIYFNKKMMYVAMTATCLLILSFSMGQYQTYQQKWIIFFSLRNGSAIGFVHRNQAWLLKDSTVNSKSLRSAVMPALEQAGVANLTLLNTHQLYRSKELQIMEHQVRFFDFQLLLADSCFNNRELHSRLKVDVVNLSQFSKLDLRQLLEHCQTKQLIIDGSSATYRTEHYKGIAENFGLPVYELGNKKAYLVNLIQ